IYFSTCCAANCAKTTKQLPFTTPRPPKQQRGEIMDKKLGQVKDDCKNISQCGPSKKQRRDKRAFVFGS
ncbi:hypothetical protein, partial [Viridibacterium curvum]|uniref:hypothetical protein n=1 Tax=Viridibacterium curvum TaxID=1101404 RepID=UPI0031E9C722